MDKNTTKYALTEYLTPLNHNFLLAIIQKHGLDRYVKKLDTITTAKLFVFAQLMQIPSYTDISIQLKAQKKLQQTIGLSSISTAQLSRKWRDMDSSFLGHVFQHMVQQVTTRFGMAKANKKLGTIHLVDASTITLCLTQYRWATYTKHKSAVKLHLRFLHADDVSYPDKAILTTGVVTDHTCMDDLIVEDKNALNVFDRGYVDYEKFDRYCEKSIRFVTRLKHNASCKTIEERKLEPNSGIEKDAVIWLGYNNTRYKMKHRLRLIECLDKDGESILICTNDFVLSAKEIADVYRNRWQIEMFFKWIKQHLRVKRCYGTSRNAVYNQIHAALIAYCLSLLMQAQTQYAGTLWKLVKQLKLLWYKTFSQFLQVLFHPPNRTSLGRRKTNEDRLFVEICLQYEKKETAHLDDLTYDPLI